MCLTCLQFFKCFQITFTLCAITFFIKCGTTHNQLQHAGIGKNDDKPKMLKQAKITPGNTGVSLLTKYPCEYFLVTPNWILLNRAPTSTQLHPAPSTSTQLISISTQLHLPPPSSFQPPPSSIYLHPAHFNLHPAPSTSTQLISTSTQLHLPPPSSFQPPPSSIYLHPAHFSLHPALCNTLNNIWTKILHVIGQFLQL